MSEAAAPNFARFYKAFALATHARTDEGTALNACRAMGRMMEASGYEIQDLSPYTGDAQHQRYKKRISDLEGDVTRARSLVERGQRALDAMKTTVERRQRAIDAMKTKRLRAMRRAISLREEVVNLRRKVIHLQHEIEIRPSVVPDEVVPSAPALVLPIAEVPDVITAPGAEPVSVPAIKGPEATILNEVSGIADLAAAIDDEAVVHEGGDRVTGEPESCVPFFEFDALAQSIFGSKRGYLARAAAHLGVHRSAPNNWKCKNRVNTKYLALLREPASVDQTVEASSEEVAEVVESVAEDITDIASERKTVPFAEFEKLAQQIFGSERGWLVKVGKYLGVNEKAAYAWKYSNSVQMPRMEALRNHPIFNRAEEIAASVEEATEAAPEDLQSTPVAQAPTYTNFYELGAATYGAYYGWLTKFMDAAGLPRHASAKWKRNDLVPTTVFESVVAIVSTFKLPDAPVEAAPVEDAPAAAPVDAVEDVVAEVTAEPAEAEETAEVVIETTQWTRHDVIAEAVRLSGNRLDWRAVLEKEYGHKVRSFHVDPCIVNDLRRIKWQDHPPMEISFAKFMEHVNAHFADEKFPLRAFRTETDNQYSETMIQTWKKTGRVPIAVAHVLREMMDEA